MEDSDTYVERYLNKEEIHKFEKYLKNKYDESDVKKIDFSKGWLIHSTLPIFADLKDKRYFVFKRFVDTYNYITVVDISTGWTTKYWSYFELHPEFIEAIESWELKQQLTPNTLKTFNELIDEL